MAQDKKQSQSKSRASAQRGTRGAQSSSRSKRQGAPQSARARRSQSAGRSAGAGRADSQPVYRQRNGAAAASAWVPPRALVIGIAIAVLVALVAGVTVSCSSSRAHEKQWQHDHCWQQTVEAAEGYYGVDSRFTAAILTMIQVESDGNVDIDKRHDILQAYEGDGKKILLKGIKKQGVKGKTPEASIYAGTYEFSLCIEDFKAYLGRDPQPDDLNDVALLAQGYNYGHLGWFKWLKKRGIDTWTLEASEKYQRRINGLGTAIHGQKIMDTYPRITGQDS